MKWLGIIGLCLVGVCHGCCVIEKPKERILIVVSLDGFKTEYLRRNITRNMEQFYRTGVIGKMSNVFPTKTFVNHFSIATGVCVCV